jgi:DNA-binding MarR family transcriptional regulator
VNQPRRDPIIAGLQRFGLERDRMRVALARRAGVTGTDLDALEHLEADGPMTQRQLGDRLLLTSGAVTMLVDRLQKEGLVARRPHPSDRRAVLLELAEGIRRDLPTELKEYHKRIAELAAEVPPEHHDAVSSLLDAAADAASRAAEALHKAPGAERD